MSGVSWHERGFRETGAPRNPISRARLERVASRVIAGFGLIFGAQTITTLLAQLPGMAMPGGMIAAVALFGGLVLVLITAIVQYGVKLAMAYFAIAYLVVVEVWPLIAVDPTYPLGSKPWVWYLCTVATAFAAVAFPLVWAAVYTVAAPTAYAVIRALPSGGGVGPGPAALDAAYAVILGGTILVIVAMLRQAASGVDRAQSAALDTYSNAVREHAMEVERVQVDAIVHDSVLTTLLSAASAETQDECLLAASMAEDAIGHLRAADAGLRSRLRAATVILDPPRSGAGKAVVAQLAELAPAQLVYVACDPIALARDVALFGERGYALRSLRAFDLFPHTHHVEAVALLTPGA